MSDELSNLIAQRFIARRDVKAVQHGDGSWAPHTVTGKHDGERLPWNRTSLNSHLERRATFGHYMLNTDDTCKLFAFDVDLEKQGFLPTTPDWHEADFATCDNLRAAWLDRGHVGRSWMKYQLKRMAHMLVRGVEETLGVQAVAAYSGGKGIHVYAFTGLIPATDAREGMMIVLDTLGCFKIVRGENFLKHENDDPFEGFPNLSIELFPKQGTLDGKDLGNLMRLPLGRNQKSTDPTFFIDMTSPIGQMVPVDPIFALSSDSPWKKPGE